MAYKIINYGSHNINQFDIKSVTETLNSAWLSQGPKVKNFENKLSKYFDSKFSILTTNGTSHYTWQVNLLDGPKKEN